LGKQDSVEESLCQVFFEKIKYIPAAIPAKPINNKMIL